MNNKAVWIVDFGSQYTQLITRRSREIGHSSEIITYETLVKRWDKKLRPKALVLSGGPRVNFLTIHVIINLFSRRKCPYSWDLLWNANYGACPWGNC